MSKELDTLQHQATFKDAARKLRDAIRTERTLRQTQGPQGEVALVFTDVQSSTYLWEMNGPAMRESLSLHNQKMRQLIRLTGGFEVCHPMHPPLCDSRGPCLRALGPAWHCFPSMSLPCHFHVTSHR